MDDTTARDERGTDRESSRGPSRRDLLATVGSVGVASALAGCDTDLTSQEFEATPVVLTGEGQEALGLTEFELAESTGTESVGDVGEVTATSYLSVHSRSTQGGNRNRPSGSTSRIPASAGSACSRRRRRSSSAG